MAQVGSFCPARRSFVGRKAWYNWPMVITVRPDDVRGAPPIMPAHVELGGLGAEEAFEMRLLARDGELFVLVDGEPAPRPVTGIWPDPHDGSRLTLFFG